MSYTFKTRDKKVTFYEQLEKYSSKKKQQPSDHQGKNVNYFWIM